MRSYVSSNDSLRKKIYLGVIFLIGIGLQIAGASYCNLNDELVLVKCASRLIDGNFLGENLSFSLKETGQLCQKYDKFRECSSEIDKNCGMLANIHAFFDFLCADDFRIMAVQERPCLTLIDDNSELSRCLKNATAEFELEFANSTAIVWKHEGATCSYVRSQLQCYTEYNFMKTCKNAVLLEYRLLSFFLANITKTKCPLPTYESLIDAFRLLERERSRGGCDANGNCHCIEGYRLENATRKCIDINECSEDTHNCSQTCINIDGSYRCSCDDRYFRLASNNRSCERIDNAPLWLYFAHGQSIWNISEDGKNFQLARMGLQKTAMIDVDVKERLLYYADIAANMIERKNIDGTFPQPVQTYEVEGVEGIAIDWVTRNLYSARKSTILVQTLEGRFRRALYVNVTKMPRALFINAPEGYIYGTDWGSSAFIYKAASDGNEFKKIITENVVWPNALTIDIYAKRLYWADAFLDTIQSCDLDGKMRKSIISDPDAVPHVFGTYRGILRANKLDGRNITVLAQTALLPYGIKVYHPSLQPEIKNPCASIGCTQLCLLSSQGRGGTCMCADGFLLETDGRTCKSNCSDSELLCGGSDPKCVSKRFMCDGFEQCLDSSDEENCPPRICPQEKFQCHDNQRCVDMNLICDGTVHCLDASDEKYCTEDFDDDAIEPNEISRTITSMIPQSDI